MNEQSRSYEAPDENKPLLPSWVCQECGGGLDPKVCYTFNGKQICRDCAVGEGVTTQAQFDEAVTLAPVGDKQLPVIHWPDGTCIHVMPHKIEGGQDPAEQLRRWLKEWVTAELTDAREQLQSAEAERKSPTLANWAEKTLLELTEAEHHARIGSHAADALAELAEQGIVPDREETTAENVREDILELGRKIKAAELKITKLSCSPLCCWCNKCDQPADDECGDAGHPLVMVDLAAKLKVVKAEIAELEAAATTNRNEFTNEIDRLHKAVLAVRSELADSQHFARIGSCAVDALALNHPESTEKDTPESVHAEIEELYWNSQELIALKAELERLKRGIEKLESHLADRNAYCTPNGGAWIQRLGEPVRYEADSLTDLITKLGDGDGA